MKSLELNDLDSVPLYIPFIHSFKWTDDICYLEVLIKVKSGETIKWNLNLDPWSINLNVIPSAVTGVQHATRFIYIDSIPLDTPKKEGENPEVKVTVIKNEINAPKDPQVQGTATVRYRDIP